MDYDEGVYYYCGVYDVRDSMWGCLIYHIPS